MASTETSIASTVALLLALAILANANLGDIECEDLNQDSCAYAVSVAGKRCVLEKYVRRSGAEEYACTASEIDADKLENWIESDACIKACGLHKGVLGISSDFLLEASFAKHLCSDECYHRCPNIVDLYFNLAAGEGVYLPKFCEGKGASARREMTEIKSSGFAMPAAESPEYVVDADSNFVDAPSLAPL